MKSKLSVVLFSLAVAACGRPERKVQPVQAPAVASATTDARVDVVTAPVTPPAPEVGENPGKVTSTHVAVSPSSFDDALARGKELADKGDREGARDMFEAAAKLERKRSEPHIELARLFIADGDRALAVAAANKATKLAPTSSRAWNTKGRAELARFAYDDAIEAFTKAVELDKDNVWAWNNLGLAELQLKKYGDAVEHLTEATTRKGATGYMWNNLGIALEQLDRLDEARTAFDKGGALGSSDAVASRKRLEGVKTIAIANDVREDKEPVATPDVDIENGGSSGSAASAAVDSGGSGSGSGSGSDESSDHATK